LHFEAVLKKTLQEMPGKLCRKTEKTHPGVKQRT